MNTEQLNYDALPLHLQRVVDTMDQTFHKQTEPNGRISYALRE